MLQCVWTSGRLTGPSIFRYEGHSNTAERNFKSSCHRQILLYPCPRFRIQCLSRCRGCYGYITALVYVKLWDSTGWIVLWYTIHYYLKRNAKFTQIPLKLHSRFHPKHDVSWAASGRQGSGNAAVKTRLSSPTPPSPLLGANPFVALAPLLRLWSCHLKNHLH